jgi:hypothetical protein
MSEEGTARYPDPLEGRGHPPLLRRLPPDLSPIAVNIISLDSVGGWASNPLDIHPFKFMKFIDTPAVHGVVSVGRPIQLASLGN